MSESDKVEIEALRAEVRFLNLMLNMAEDTIGVERRTSDRFWTIICDLVAGKGG
ncbi:hypothetical protein LCGC14_0455130 [marine sediment metagenome]|uniref:Uncharacterized protein n=1 Tax=marine sediment metagenome TaxID=412755 RepID=A0A0F9SLV6_9ZZZZ